MCLKFQQNNYPRKPESSNAHIYVLLLGSRNTFGSSTSLANSFTKSSTALEVLCMYVLYTCILLLIVGGVRFVPQSAQNINVGLFRNAEWRLFCFWMLEYKYNSYYVLIYIYCKKVSPNIYIFFFHSSFLILSLLGVTFERVKYYRKIITLNYTATCTGRCIGIGQSVLDGKYIFINLNFTAFCTSRCICVGQSVLH